MSPTVKKLAAKKSPAKPRAPRVKKVAVAAPVVPVDAVAAPKQAVATVPARTDFLYGIGRRKAAVSRVRLYKNGTGVFVVNNRPADQYFCTFELRDIIIAPLVAVGQAGRLDVSARVAGGGLRGQAEAVRLGVARALLGLNPTYRRSLRKVGLLTRDARIKERKKPGLKRARRAPQWQKR